MHIDPAFTDRLADLMLVAKLGWVAAVLVLLMFAHLIIRVAARRAIDPDKSPAQRLKTLAHAEDATASMEYLMVLFPFLVIVMTVWQLAFMLNAQLHVGYSVFAAARSAAVMIPAKIGSEEEGKMTKEGAKWTNIKNASIPGTIAISPGLESDAAGVALARRKSPDFPSAAEVSATLTIMGAHHTSPGLFSGTRMRRTIAKSAYARTMTDVTIEHQGVKVRSDGDLDMTAAGGDLATMGDRITVTVDYIFWMQVPYVGRTMAALLGDSGFLATEFPSIPLDETILIHTWPRKRAIKPCNP